MVTQKSILGLKYRVQCDIIKLKSFVEIVETDLIFFFWRSTGLTYPHILLQKGKIYFLFIFEQAGWKLVIYMLGLNQWKFKSKHVSNTFPKLGCLYGFWHGNWENRLCYLKRTWQDDRLYQCLHRGWIVLSVYRIDSLRSSWGYPPKAALQSHVGAAEKQEKEAIDCAEFLYLVILYTSSLAVNQVLFIKKLLWCLKLPPVKHKKPRWQDLS